MLIDKNNFEDQLRRDFEQKALLDQKQFSNAYFLEKEELCMELSLLQDLSKEYDKMKLDTDLKFFMQKWKYYSKIQSLISLNSDQVKEAAEEERHQFFKRQMDRLSQHGGAAISILKDDLKIARTENNELAEKISKLEFETYSMRNEKESLMKNALKQ